MSLSREYPERPIVGVGGIVIEEGRALLIRRGGEPLRGQWSIPGGTLEIGETLVQGVAREMLEETGLSVRVLELIELFERISPAEAPNPQGANGRPRFHFVIADFLCERISGEAHAGGDAMDLAFASEDELQKFQLTETATRILRKAFTLERSRQARASPL